MGGNFCTIRSYTCSRYVETLLLDCTTQWLFAQNSTDRRHDSSLCLRIEELVYASMWCCLHWQSCDTRRWNAKRCGFSSSPLDCAWVLGLFGGGTPTCGSLGGRPGRNSNILMQQYSLLHNARHTLPVGKHHFVDALNCLA